VEKSAQVKTTFPEFDGMEEEEFTDEDYLDALKKRERSGKLSFNDEEEEFDQYLQFLQRTKAFQDVVKGKGKEDIN
jgi:hypothetical protein